MSEKQEFVWWEKTVEYAFVRYILADNAVAAPMDGYPEKWLGDLIDCVEDKFRLIEFKRNEDAISNENEKYGKDCQSYLDACKKIPDKDEAAHWLIFGEGILDGQQKPKLSLKYRHYHAASGSNLLKASANMSMMSLVDFKKYIDELMVLRGRDASSSGGMVMAGVGNDQFIVLGLDEFNLLSPRLAEKNGQSHTASKNIPKG